MEKTNPYYQLSSLEDGTFDKACESEDIKQYEKRRGCNVTVTCIQQ
ncbi:MAG: hypothetical protein IKO03_04145 [Lachnospiraceae bacterium]|nr:hypothetical protein [Lachnospiraceae bacterium]